MNRAWEEVQQRTFTRWVNAQLKKKGVQIQDLTKDFGDGLNLIYLYESIADVQFPRYNKNPKMRINKIENINLVVAEVNKFVASVGIKVKFSAEQVADGVKTIILGMVWVLIHKFAIQDISEEEMHARDGLLLWCKKKTDGYKNVKVENFHTSWKSGLAFCALIHKHYPNLINYDSLDPNDHAKNLQLAFDVAEKDLDIPQLLDVNDIVSQEKPDEKSIMAYVAYYWKKFASTGKQQKSANMIGRLGKKDAEYAKIAHDYEERAKKLVSWIAEKDKQYSDCSNLGNSLAKVQAVDKAFKGFKNEEKPKQNEERADLEITLKNLRSKQKNDGLKIYNPPPELATEAINGHWDHLTETQKTYESAVREAILKMKHLEKLLVKFRIKAKQNLQWNKSKQENELAEVPAKMTTIAAVSNKIKAMESFDEDLEGQKKALSENTKIGEEIVNGGHEAAAEVKQSNQDTNDATNKSSALATTYKENLNQRLTLLQRIEQQQLEFANIVQEINTVLDDSNNSLVETVESSSVEEIEKKISSHEEIVGKYKEQQAKVSSLEPLHKEVTELGDNSAKYSTFTFEEITQKNQQTGTQLDQRTGELAKEKEVQLLRVQLITEWNEKAKAFHEQCAAIRKDLESVEEGTLMKQLQTIQGKSNSVSDCITSINELKGLQEKLISADCVDKVEISLQTLEVEHGENEEILKKKLADLEAQLLNLFKNGSNQYLQWNKTKQTTELSEDVTKIPSVSSIQTKMKAMEALEKDFEGQKSNFASTQSVGQEMVSANLDSANEVQQILNACAEATETTGKLIGEINEKLKQHLALKQAIEEKSLKFASLVQDVNGHLDNAMNSLVVGTVASGSVEEIEKKIQDHEAIVTTHTGSADSMKEIEQLHKEVTELGDNSGRYSNLSYEEITKKYGKVTEDLGQRSGELEQEKQKQLQHSKMLEDWNQRAKALLLENAATKENVEKEEQGTLMQQLKTLTGKSEAVQKCHSALEELKPVHEQLVEAGIAGRVEVALQTLETSIRDLDEAQARKTKDLNDKLLNLFKNGVKQYLQWNRSKQSTELAEDVTKIPSVASTQTKMKAMEALEKDFDGQKKTFAATQTVGDEIIAENLEYSGDVQQSLKNCSEATETTGKLIEEINEKLKQHLALKQAIEEKSLKFASVAQDFNGLLDNEKNSLVVTVTSSSAEEVDKKIRDHEAIVSKHKEGESMKNSLTELDNEITALGDNPAKYSNFTLASLSEKYDKTGAELETRTADLNKEKELQMAHVKLLDEWNQKGKDYFAACSENTQKLSVVIEGSYSNQLQALKQQGDAIISESASQLSELKGLFEGLVAASISKRVQVSMESLQVAHASLENLLKKRTSELEQKNRLLEKVYSRFKSQSTNINNEQTKKKEYLDTVLSKVTGISSIQSEVSNTKSIAVAVKGLAESLGETAKCANDLIAQKHDDSKDIESKISAMKSENESLDKQSKAVEEELMKKLAHKQAIEGKCVQFAKTANQLDLFAEDALGQLQEPVAVSSVKEVDALIESFSKLKTSYDEKAPLLQEIVQLHKEVSDDGEKPEMYSSVTLSQVQNKFQSIKTPLNDKLQLLDVEKKKQQELEDLVSNYISKFSEYSKFIDTSTSDIEKEQQGELEDQLKTVKDVGVTLSKKSKDQLKQLTDLFGKIEAADITEQVVSIQEASQLDSKLQKTIAKRMEALESSILSKKQSNISEAQLKDFHDTFRHFDRDKSGYLTKLPFKACCAAVGEDIPDNKLEETFNGYDTDHDGKISFDEFLTFISSVAKAGSGKEDILQAFRDLSGGNKYISEQQIRGNFDKEQAEQFLSQMPKTDEGYDYEAYCNNTFASQ